MAIDRAKYNTCFNFRNGNEVFGLREKIHFFKCPSNYTHNLIPRTSLLPILIRLEKIKDVYIISGESVANTLYE